MPRDPYSFTKRDALDWLFVIVGMTVINLLVVQMFGTKR